MRWRTMFAYSIFALIGATIIGRLFFLQIVHYGLYKAFAQGQQNFTSVQTGDRGSIYATDKDGKLYAFASNRHVQFAFASPFEIQNKEQAADEAAHILQLPKAEISQKLQNQESLYEVLKQEITPREASALKEKAIPGLYVGNKTIRSYPQGTMAAQLIGFTNQDGKGQYGVEEYYNDILEGKEGLANRTVNPARYLLFGLGRPPQDGSDIILSIDYNIQATAERLLNENKKPLGFEEGSIVVMDPKSGKILALASTPSFDPNDYGAVKDAHLFQNPITQKLFEPGSIFKPITMAAGIDTGSVTPDTSYIDKGTLKIGGYSIYNYGQRVWGPRTMKQVLEFSINTGVAFAEAQMGHDRFMQYVERFGFFEPTRVDLPEEAYSQNKSLKEGHEINYTTASFGQGIEATAMQVMKAFTAFINNGVMAVPYVAQAKVDLQGNSTPLHVDEQSTRVVASPKTMGQITDMLVGVTEEGYGKKARVPGYYTAGKTGTAQVSWSSMGIAKPGYSDKTIQSFIGYTPAFNPSFLILVKLVDPKAGTAEYSAEPIFQKLQKYILTYEQIPPDYTP